MGQRQRQKKNRRRRSRALPPPSPRPGDAIDPRIPPGRGPDSERFRRWLTCSRTDLRLICGAIKRGWDPTAEARATIVAALGAKFAALDADRPRTLLALARAFVRMDAADLDDAHRVVCAAQRSATPGPSEAGALGPQDTGVCDTKRDLTTPPTGGGV